MKVKDKLNQHKSVFFSLLALSFLDHEVTQEGMCDHLWNIKELFCWSESAAIKVCLCFYSCPGMTIKELPVSVWTLCSRILTWNDEFCWSQRTEVLRRSQKSSLASLACSPENNNWLGIIILYSGAMMLCVSPPPCYFSILSKSEMWSWIGCIILQPTNSPELKRDHI